MSDYDDVPVESAGEEWPDDEKAARRTPYVEPIDLKERDDDSDPA